MTPKEKVLAAFPHAVCVMSCDAWRVWVNRKQDAKCVGEGFSASSAWRNAFHRLPAAKTERISKTVPRKVYHISRGCIGPGEFRDSYTSKILWSEFDGFGLVSNHGYDPEVKVISMNAICEEGDKKP